MFFVNDQLQDGAVGGEGAACFQRGEKIVVGEFLELDVDAVEPDGCGHDSVGGAGGQR